VAGCWSGEVGGAFTAAWVRLDKGHPAILRRLSSAVLIGIVPYKRGRGMEKGWCGHRLGPAADHHRAAPAPEAASGAGDARWVSSGLDEGG
jgi:hypothetical protein